MMTILGIALDDDNLYEHVLNILINNYQQQFKSEPLTVPGCEHKVPPSNNYCAECGKKAWVNNPKIPKPFKKKENLCLSEFLDDADYGDLVCEHSEYDCYWVIGKNIENLDETKSIVDLKIEIATEFNQKFNSTVPFHKINFHPIMN